MRWRLKDLSTCQDRNLPSHYQTLTLLFLLALVHEEVAICACDQDFLRAACVTSPNDTFAHPMQVALEEGTIVSRDGHGVSEKTKQMHDLVQSIDISTPCDKFVVLQAYQLYSM